MTPPGLEPGTHWLKITSTIELRGLSLCDPGGARTHDPLIKSQLLYLLSYEVKMLFDNQKMERFELPTRGP